MGGNEGAGIDEPVEAELGSVFAQGSKKQSLNHLLNFHFKPRQSLVGTGRKVAARGGGIGTVKHKYNKEQFLQAK